MAQTKISAILMIERPTAILAESFGGRVHGSERQSRYLDRLNSLENSAELRWSVR